VNFIEESMSAKKQTKSQTARLKKKLREANSRAEFLGKLSMELLEKRRRRSLITGEPIY